VAIAVLPSGNVNAHFGNAKKVALATIEDKQIVNWEEVDVPFAKTHGGHSHDHHHHHHHEEHHHEHGPGHVQAIRKFIVEHQVDLVLLDHAGPSIQKIRKDIDVKVVVGAEGNAKEAVQALIDQGFTD